MQIRQLIRFALSALAAPPLVILYLNIEKVAEDQGWDRILVNISGIEEWPVTAFLLQPWAAVASLCFVCFVAGIWADTLLRRLDRRAPTKQQRLQNLGLSLIALSEEIERQLSLINSGIYYATKAKVLVMAESMRKEGFPTPRIDPDRTDEQYLRWVRYGTLIGNYLVNGHGKEAKRLAKSFPQDDWPDPRPQHQLDRSAAANRKRSASQPF
ncbi:MAG: hypothetical protein WD341_10895 [Tistlia sp.]|uniref:hypothetical protein n=1 Tax=Tistlia sp. TaxID=3057121 RepID=UPI0034A13316